MNRILLLCFSAVTLVISGSHAQSIDTANTPIWIEMMQDPNANFFETQHAFELYWDGRERSRGDGYKIFRRWEWFWSQRINEDGTFPAPDATINAYTNWKIAWNQQQMGPESESGDWVEIGPRPKPVNGTGQPNGNGRLNYVAFHPTNPNIMFVGSPSGGFWKTTNGGSSWTTSTDGLPTLGVSSILLDTSNTNIIYIGTGDRDANDAPGLGVYKSTDGGATFSQSNSGMGNRTVGQLLMHPDDADYLLAATNNGIYRSLNAGGTWSQVNGSGNFKDMKFKPGDPDIVYATETSSGAGFWKSTDGGASWTQITSGLPTSPQRYTIGVSPAAPEVVYVVASVSSAYGGLYKSTNSGSSFSTQSTTPNILTWNEFPPTSGGGGQGWYDLALAVDPMDEEVVYVGGVNVFKSTNSGVSWDCVAHWVGSGSAASVHADHHWLEFSPADGNLYDANDGGLYKTANGGSTWSEISDSLGIAQIYKIGVSQNTYAKVINGYQDNGTSVWDANGFRTERGGDGMECVVDYANDNVMYASVYYGNIARSTNNGFSFGTFAAQNVNGITESGAWVTPYTLSNHSPSTMFIGYKNVWRTSSTANPSFTAISSGLAGSNSSNMRQLRQSKVNSNRLYALRSDNKLFRSDNALGSNPTWTDLTSNLPSGWYISDIETSPESNNKLWIIRNNVVYRSTNGGSSWTSINGNLPGVSKNCLLADPYTDGGLYVGTDAGVYYIDDNLSNWVPFDDGLPVSAEVTELEIYHVPGYWEARRIRAATYGRGLWESDLYDPGTWAPMAFGESSLSGVGPCDPGVLTLLSTSAYGVDSMSWNVYPSSGAAFVNGTNASSNPAQLTFTEAGTYDVVLYVENANGADSVVVVNNFTVTTPAAVLTSNSINNAYCEGDTALISANLGMVSYNFYLNGVLYQVGSNSSVEIEGVSPGDVVTVSVVDANGCTDDASLSLNVSPSPSSVLTTDNGLQICAGDTITFSHGGTWASQTYLLNSVPVGNGTSWTTDSLNDGDSIQVSIVDSSGCTGTSNLIVMDVLPLPPTPSILQLLDSLECTVLGSNYEWTLNDSLTSETDQFYNDPVDGTYEVRVFENGCWSAWSGPIDIVGTGIATIDRLKVRIFPSPANQYIFVALDQRERNIDQILLIDMHGKTVFKENNPIISEGQPLRIDLDGLAAGVYSIIITSEGERVALPIVKEMR